MVPMSGGIANPPNAPSPPTHPAAPPTASGTSWATSLNTAALATPIPAASKTSAATDSPKLPETVMRTAPASMTASARIPVVSPPSPSERYPPPTRDSDVRIEYPPASDPATTRVAAWKEVQ